MKSKTVKALSAYLVAMIVLGMLLAFPVLPVHAQTTYVSVMNPDSTHDLSLVDPTYWDAARTYALKYDIHPADVHDLIFHSDTQGGDKFYVDVKCADGDNVWNWQVKLLFDASLLQCSEAFVPATSIFKLAMNPAPSINNVAGSVMLGSTQLSGDPGINGSDVLARIVFTVFQGAAYGEYYSCNLTLDDTYTFLKDPGMAPKPFTEEEGYYELFWVIPSTTPYFEVVPYEYKATTLGQDVKIDIYVRDCDPSWEIIAFQGALMFNATLLEGTTYDAGTFLESSVNGGETGVLYFENIFGSDPNIPVGYNAWAFGAMVMPGPSGWEEPFADGDGLLISLHFNAIYETQFPAEAWTDLTITNLEKNPLDPHDNLNCYGMNQYMGKIFIDPDLCDHGRYRAPVRVTGRMIDVFTQYPDGFNGKGINEPSDMFFPQKEVILYANVTYNEWPEQQKDVAFQVIDPHGATWAIFSNKTNDVGVACVKFRLPWPCEVPEYWFGEWTVIATVDVACIVVNDTLTFHYDYLVHIWSVTPDKGSYKHCEDITVTIEFGTHAMQEYTVVITLTAVDETGVPFGYIYVELTVGGAIYCHYKDYSTDLRVHVVKFARAGVARLYACALSDFPFAGGYDLFDYPAVEVNIEAAWA